ncbi:MAG: hypothetical protein DCC49_00050 [Acidobacteria bacterium]|nr:MAG: hypothetical protein DCC49_00050 [Acidobacteriota bacterium]
MGTTGQGLSVGLLDLLTGRWLSVPRLGEVSSMAAQHHGDRSAFEILPGSLRGEPKRTEISYAEFDSLVEALASDIASKLGAEGESAFPRIVVRGPNGVMFLASVLAASRAGAVAVPANPELTPQELEHVVADCGARVEIAPPEAAVLDGIDRVETRWSLLHDRSRKWPSPDLSEVAAIFYTSGTTGNPKGAMLTHRGLFSDISLAGAYPFRSDFMVEALPTAHIMGFLVLAGALLAGIRTFAMERFRPVRVLDALESFGASMFVGVPAMYRMLLDAGAAYRDLKSVRVWMSAADVMPRDLAREFQRMGSAFTLGGRPVGEALFVEAYGMVEYSGAATVKISLPFWDPFSSSIGIPLPGTSIKIIDESGKEVRRGEVGEIAIRGGKVLHSYRNREDETGKAVQGGWLRTGDLAKRGLVTDHFAGRSKDVVTSGGYTVYAVEVEEALRSFAGVADAAVVGVADHVLGERVAAAIEVEAGAKIDLDELRVWADSRLAGYKRPVEYAFVEELPRGSTRKVKKDQVRQLFEGESDDGS